MGLLVRERASLPVSVKERDWGEKGGSFWYHCDAMGDQQLDCLFLGVLGVEQREDSSESVMEEIRGLEEMEHQWNNDLQHCLHGYDCLLQV